MIYWGFRSIIQYKGCKVWNIQTKGLEYRFQVLVYIACVGSSVGFMLAVLQVDIPKSYVSLD